MSDFEFEIGDAGAANITMVEAGTRKPGSLIMLRGEFPCKVVSFTTAKPGKHGSAKAVLLGKDIFTDKQYSESFGTDEMIQVPLVTKTEYFCVDVTRDGNLHLLTGDCKMKEDLNLPRLAHLKHLEKELRAIIDAGKKEALVVV